MQLFSLRYLLLLVMLSSKAFAGASIADVSESAMEPLGVFSDFIYVACFVIGASFVFAGIVKYFEHRRSPLMVPLSTVIFLVIAGLVLLAVPLLSFVEGAPATTLLAK